MRDFNLELAKQGHPVCTRDGRPARVIFWEAKGDFPIIALITLSDGSEDHVSYTINGEFSMGKQDGVDLMMAPVKHEGWVNIYQFTAGHYSAGQSVYKNEEDAVHSGKGVAAYVATAKIEWEEQQ